MNFFPPVVTKTKETDVVLIFNSVALFSYNFLPNKQRVFCSKISWQEIQKQTCVFKMIKVTISFMFFWKKKCTEQRIMCSPLTI